MLRSKKAARPRTKLQKHNNQDTRVTVDCPSSHDKKGKGEKWTAMLRDLRSFLIRQLLIEIWKNRQEYWESASEIASKILEALGS
ncbi:hypothetical protein HNO91_26660 [Pseudomonas corrugata]|uniref:Uncharacterized protein n=1 Tax=Pseudomonas corrugata TaxID=47879 RepID=A0A7Y5ZCP7_9PSED|nr:hypothetical protein [Pseudomonas corrugata]NUT90021.1 hypothetical protein [Pseudomonas corrugata]